MQIERLSKLMIGLGLLLVGGYIAFNGLKRISTDKLIAPKGIVHLERVDSQAERSQGLSGRDELARGNGMLFVFEKPSKKHCLWMKDMLFPLDMIWMDENKKVVTVKRDVRPETYPKTFCPTAPAKYALEVNITLSKTWGIEPGTVLKFR